VLHLHRLIIQQVCKLWHELAASSRVICKILYLPALYDSATPWQDILRWTTKRAGLVEDVEIETFPAKKLETPLHHVRLTAARSSAPCVNVSCMHDILPFWPGFVKVVQCVFLVCFCVRVGTADNVHVQG
jgi:hypothetical protein